MGPMAVAGHALGLAGRLAEVLTKDGGPDLDIDGSESEPRRERERRAPARPRPRPASAPARPPAATSGAETPTATIDAETPTATIDAETPAATIDAETPAATIDAETPPAALDETPPHVSEERVLVDEVAEPGAEDGAGAEVHVDEPWENYDLLGAADVIDQITGAPTAVLAAVELYEQSHRRRKTVLEAVERRAPAALVSRA